MDNLLQTVAEIAAAFAGFASVVVMFRRGQNLNADKGTKVTFQSMLLGALFVIFFALLPNVLSQIFTSTNHVYSASAAHFLLYIVVSFVWGISQGATSPSAVPYAIAALTIAATQIAGLTGLLPIAGMYIIGVFALLIISGYAFYALISFTDDA